VSYISLESMIYDAGSEPLPEPVQAGLLALLGARCRGATKARLARRLAWPAHLWFHYGIYHRVHIDPDNWKVSYCAGQDYTSEIRTVRECVLEG